MYSLFCFCFFGLVCKSTVQTALYCAETITNQYDMPSTGLGWGKLSRVPNYNEINRHDGEVEAGNLTAWRKKSSVPTGYSWRNG